LRLLSDGRFARPPDAECLGHSTIAITLDTYSHVMRHIQAEAAEALDAALQRP
jgi:integrase